MALGMAGCGDPYRVIAGGDGCDLVPINGPGSYSSLRHSAIVRIARLRGLTGPITWVEVATPTSPGVDTSIRRMALVPAKSVDGVDCTRGVGLAGEESLNCSANLAGTSLSLYVEFERGSLEVSKQRTEQLAAFASENFVCR